VHMPLRSWALMLALLLGAAVVATPPPDAHARPDALVKRETSARKKCADELIKLAKWCSLQRAFDVAEAELRRGAAIQPDHPKLAAALARLDGKEPAPKKGFAGKFEAKRAKAHAKCVALLAAVSARYDEADRSAPFDQVLALTQKSFPQANVGADFGLVYFEPYAKWVRKADEERLSNGGELVDGEWLDPDGVAALNVEHATWSNPWKVSDDVHEVITPMPLRTARSVLAYVAAERAFILDYFAEEWDLRTPKGKLPVIVTETQAELRVQLAKASGGAGGATQAAAMYLQSNGELDPCFLTFEPRGAGGQTIKIGFRELLWALRHEIAHQVFFEYSKHSSTRTRMIENQFWAVEGVANFLAYYVLGESGWKLTHPRTIPFSKQGVLEGAFAWSQKTGSRLVPIEQFVEIPQAAFGKVENYHYAATLAYFLFEGADRKYRKGFVDLLSAVHAVHDTPDLWAKSFVGVDPAELNAEFQAFVAGLKLD